MVTMNNSTFHEVTWAVPDSPSSICALVTSTQMGKLSTKEKRTYEDTNESFVDPLSLKHEPFITDANEVDTSDGGAESQAKIDDLNYVSVTEYEWPTQPKRQRMTAEERKARHREVQRQFMQRKFAKLDDMRQRVVVLEKQFLLLQANQERARLEHENAFLQQQVGENQTDGLLSQDTVHFCELGDRVLYPALPWDEILEAVIDENI